MRTTIVATALTTVLLLAPTAGSDGGIGEGEGLHAEFDAILGDAVRDELVDYQRVRSRHRKSLESYLQRLAEVELATLSEADRLALLINLYNATMVKTVVDRYDRGFSPSAGAFRAFKEKLVRLEGRLVSLDELEHEIIRREFSEPRIHVALVCAARSCPPLLPRAFRGVDLEEVLEAKMRTFVNDRTRNIIDLEDRRLRLSKIFKWYAEDFGGRDALAAYVNRYTEADVSDFEVSFLDYSWQLNDVR